MHRNYSLPIILFIGSAIIFLIHFIFFRYSFPQNNVDEASFFSPAYNLASNGHLASTVHQDFLPGAAAHTYWMPPLYMVLLGVVLKIFGASVTVAKLFSLLLTLMAAVLLSRLSKDRRVQLMMAALFSICPFVLISSAFIRMEALGLFISACALLIVRRNAPAYVAGLIAGLAVMTHPLMLACAAGIALVMAFRNFKSLLLFALTALIVISPYLIYIFQDLTAFKAQMALQFSRKSEAGLSHLSISYLLQLIPLAGLAIFCLIKTKGEKPLKLFLYTAIGLSFLVILRSNEFNYYVYLVPYALASLALLMEQRPAVKGYQLFLPLAAFVFFACVLVLKLSKYTFHTDHTYHELIRYAEKDTRWDHRRIYVAGNPDLTPFFIVKGEQVQRENAVASVHAANWLNNYDCVIDVSDVEGALPASDSTSRKPWLNWPWVIAYTTSDHTSTLRICTR